MFKRLPPHDIQAEESVVASLMVDTEAIFKVAPILRPRDFFRETNGWTYDACLALWERNETINQVTVAHELDRRGRLEEVGGLSFLSGLALNLPAAGGGARCGGARRWPPPSAPASACPPSSTSASSSTPPWSRRTRPRPRPSAAT